MRCADLYFIRGTLTPGEQELLGRSLFCDPVVETVEFGNGPFQGPPAGARRVEVAFRPGVTDPVAAEIVRAAKELGVNGVEAATTGSCYDIEGESLSDADLALVADRLLANPVIQRWSLGRIEPHFAETAAASSEVERFDIASMDDDALMALSNERRAALDLDEMKAVRGFFRAEKRTCTDVEFEMIAQTWSEHCVHKTFRARIDVDAPQPNPYGGQVDNILKTFIKKATDEIDAPWVLSAFVDNAGVIEFDDEYEVSFKVETHNHPSAIEPFGGANTGVGGVIRDVVGVSARPIAATDVLCFGPLDTPVESLPAGVIHPRLVFSGVVSGVQDYGNKIGIPTVNGGVRFDPGYTANPLVYCGCVGLAPRGLRKSEAKAGDRVVLLGGATGRDGIRGATFSSMTMDSSTGEVAGASVQIGDPVVEKKTTEVIIQARDLGLYSAITDCGAGGLSSAVGEMAQTLGADIDLDAVPLKYPGLVPWEVWLSEAQERMVLAVPEKNMAKLRELCERNDVDMTDLGPFTGKGRLVVKHGGKAALDLPGEFLHKGLPQRKLKAAPPAKKPETKKASGSIDPKAALLSLLGHPNVGSRESVVRLYDHEIQGATCVKPFEGPERDGPSDAAVLKPLETKGTTAVAVSNGFNPDYGADPYRMALSAVDEAVRNVVATGADPDRVAILDNFCWGDPKRPENMWSLLEAARGCKDAAIAHRAPFVSGKDSFNNEYKAADGQRVSIPPSLLISAIAIVPDVGRKVTMDLKKPGNPLYLVGEWKPVAGGSLVAKLYGVPAGASVEVPDASPRAHDAYKSLHRAMSGGLVVACHDLSEGGLGVAVAEMCIGGRLGAALDLPAGDAIINLYGETNGCLVAEVPAGKAAEFEKAMAGAPCAKIGRVTDDGTLAVKGAASFAVPVATLVDAWKGAIGGGK